jgi:uncharacterized membrane protein YeaQ/YmgE (transglycosylase-associated protein family)
MALLTILWLLLTGLVVGVLARLAVPGRQHVGLLLTTLLGVLGSLGGAYLVGAADPSLGTAGRFVVAVAVAALLVAVVDGAFGRRRRGW